MGRALAKSSKASVCFGVGMLAVTGRRKCEGRRANVRWHWRTGVMRA